MLFAEKESGARYVRRRGQQVGRDPEVAVSVRPPIESLQLLRQDRSTRVVAHQHDVDPRGRTARKVGLGFALCRGLEPSRAAGGRRGPTTPPHLNEVQGEGEVRAGGTVRGQSVSRCSAGCPVGRPSWLVRSATRAQPYICIKTRGQRGGEGPGVKAG